MQAVDQTSNPRPGLRSRLGAAVPIETETSTFVTFDLGDQTFAVDVANVREILDAQEISPLPNATSDLMGMIDIRGQGIPVMDLSLPLGLHRRTHGEADERLIVLDFAEDAAPTVAIAADRVRSVIEIAASVIDPVPQVPGTWASGAMKGVTRLDGALVYVIDLREALRMAPQDRSGLKGPFDFD
ncbi:chemotaxis protein CheW [Stagnihabitans tardus]|uniref:Chemotaxis protein CheW n=1 Tax=Stagnihabitans tardus TaxID=2699202 RepID=A0AAE4Y8P3_9RHOB|nr:chemotaxis protein CheW [Stagnihabitans tardus]NBZ86723.1 chemotaxis protein CheW [Stagnihabitans tardus]